MKKILVIGKGNVFSSMVHFLSIKNVKKSVGFIQYKDQNDVLRNPFLKNDKILEFERIYLFPETEEEGIFLTAHFSGIFIGILFVVTTLEEHDSDINKKQLETENIIVRKVECKRDSWFPKELEIL
jgi:hypothetical protein